VMNQIFLIPVTWTPIQNWQEDAENLRVMGNRKKTPRISRNLLFIVDLFP
jgi:hypothetical protein